MSDTTWIMLAALGGELLLLVLVLLSVAFFRSRVQRRRDLKAVSTLVARIKKAKSEREQKIAAFLAQGMALSGDTLNQAKVAMLRAELRVLQRFASVYRGRDAALASRFDDDLFAAIDPYHALVAGEAGAAAATDAEPVDAAELAHLRKENKRLSDELRITMETMSRMLNEYSSMFVGGERDDAAPISATATAGAVAAASDGPNSGHNGDVRIADSVDESVTADAVEASAVPAASDGDVQVAVDDGGNLDVADAAVAQAAETPGDIEDLVDSIFDQPVADGSNEADAAADDVAVLDDEPAPDAVIAGGVDAVGEPSDAQADAAIDDDDEIAAILHEAQSREMSARAEFVDEVNAEPAAELPETATEPGLDTLEEGEAEIVDFGDTEEVDVPAIEDLDDLFDASGDDPFDDVAAEDGPAADAQASVKSQAGG